MDGVAEEAAEFRRDAFVSLARFRSFAEGAPLFEVLEINGDRARIKLAESGEAADVHLADVQDSIVAT